MPLLPPPCSLMGHSRESEVVPSGEAKSSLTGGTERLPWRVLVIFWPSRYLWKEVFREKKKKKNLRQEQKQFF